MTGGYCTKPAHCWVMPAVETYVSCVHDGEGIAQSLLTAGSCQQWRPTYLVFMTGGYCTRPAQCWVMPAVETYVACVRDGRVLHKACSVLVMPAVETCVSCVHDGRVLHKACSVLGHASSGDLRILCS